MAETNTLPTNEPTAFDRLSKVDVSKYIEKKDAGNGKNFPIFLGLMLGLM